MPVGVYKRTQENKENISKGKMGSIPWNKGMIGIVKSSDETKKKISLANMGREHSEETRKKISESHKGLKHGDGAKRKMSEYRTGLKLSEETKRKMSQSRMGRERGGISHITYPADWTQTLKQSIRERDNYVCQECGIHQDELEGWNKRLDVHHIDYDKNNCNPTNLVSLCRSCHAKTNADRDSWFNYFNNTTI